MALLMPWYIFLFVGAFDWGFYAHALISTESAARVAALYASGSKTTASDSAGACTYALAELKAEANGTSLTCSSSSLPLIVTAQNVTPVSSCADGQACAQVTVTYQTIGVIPIPGPIQSQPTFYRVVQMPLKS